MTFREQVWWCRKWGTVAFLLGLLLIGTAYVLADNVDKKWLEFLLNLVTASLFVAGVLCVFGGLLRPLQKAFYHIAFEGTDRYRRQLVINPMAFWLWIDSEGRNRDA